MPALRRAEQTVSFLERRDTPSFEEAYSLFEAGVAYIWRRCDILNFDLSVWKNDVGIVSGSVNVDISRPERRSGDIILDNIDGDLDPDPDGGFWYDKVLRIWRGVVVDRVEGDDLYFDGTANCWLLGTFMIDRLKQSSRDTAVGVSFRDLTKKMQNSKLSVATTFVEGTEVVDVVRAMALNSGLPGCLAPPIDKTLGRDFSFEQNTSRWDIANQVLEAYGLEGFCDVDGWFVIRPFTDPVSSPASLLLVGHPDGVCAHGYRSNIGSYEKSSSDTRMYNHVVVRGESTGGALPVTAEAENNEPTSNTRIERIGRRTYTYASQFIETEEQAMATAQAFLTVHALEQFEVGTNGIVYPFLDAGTTIEFHDKNERMNETDAPIGKTYMPIRFLLQNFTIPLGLGEMAVSASRVSIVDNVRRWSGEPGLPGLLGISGKFTGIQKIFGQTGLIAITPSVGTFGPRQGVAATLALTARAGLITGSKIGNNAIITLAARAGVVTSAATKTANPATILILTPTSGLAGGTVIKTAQVATITFTTTQGVWSRSITPQSANLTITGRQGSSVGGPKTITAQVATFSLSGTPGILGGGLSFQAQRYVFTLTAVPTGS